MKHLLACSNGWFNLWTLTRLIEEINHSYRRSYLRCKTLSTSVVNQKIKDFSFLQGIQRKIHVNFYRIINFLL